MPYLDNKIETSKHKKSCNNPVGKRLYIRDYNDKGKTCFVSWGLTCTTCGVVIKEKFQPNLTPRELKYVELMNKPEGPAFSKLMESLTGGRPRPETSTEDQLKWRRDRKIANKLGRLRRKGQSPITPSERSLRVKLYKFEGRLNRQFGAGRQYRPNELCEKFLSLNPRPTMQELSEALYPLGYDIYKKNTQYRRIKLIPDLDPNRPQKAGKINLKQDWSGWIPDPDREGYIIQNSDPNFKTDWIKLTEEETRLRRQVMKRVIESRGEEVPTED